MQHRIASIFLVNEIAGHPLFATIAFCLWSSVRAHLHFSSFAVLLFLALPETYLLFVAFVRTLFLLENLWSLWPFKSCFHLIKHVFKMIFCAWCEINIYKIYWKIVYGHVHRCWHRLRIDIPLCIRKCVNQQFHMKLLDNSRFQQNYEYSVGVENVPVSHGIIELWTAIGHIQLEISSENTEPQFSL